MKLSSSLMAPSLLIVEEFLASGRYIAAASILLFNSSSFVFEPLSWLWLALVPTLFLLLMVVALSSI